MCDVKNLNKLYLKENFLLEADFFSKILITIPCILLALTVHEFFHGWAAWQLGDPTAKYEGRLTLNPIAHLDPIGSVVLLVTTIMGPFPLGWAKPVPVAEERLGRTRTSLLFVALAGPASNLLMAFLGGLIFKTGIAGTGFFAVFVYYFVLINIGLGLFNLLPVPPLDGWKILRSILPADTALRLENMLSGNYAVSMIIFLIVVYFAGYILAIPFSFLIKLFLL